MAVACGEAGVATPVPNTPLPPSTQALPAIPTDTPVPSTETPATIPTQTFVPSQGTAEPNRSTEIPKMTPAQTQAAEPAAPAIDPTALDPREVAERALRWPEIMACLTEAVGFATLLQLAEREPTEEEIRLLTPCVEIEDSTSDGTAGGSAEDQPTKAT